MAEIQRYSVGGPGRIPSSRGPWVLYADHIAALAALQREIDLRVEQGRALNEDKERFKHENAKLREALKASEWQRITPNNLPKLGDEMFCAGREGDGDWITEFDGSISEFGQHWTHFRPINAPKEASK
jgi:hypothetical protein